MSHRTLIDLTDIELWSGHHGGIQRVVYGIAKNFFLDDNAGRDLRFISFDAVEKKFYFTSFEPIYRRVEGLEEPVALSPQADTLDGSKKRKIKQFVPEAVRKNKYVRKGFRTSVALLPSSAKNKLFPSKPPISPTPSKEWVDFRKDDTVLVLGKPWDNLDIQANLSSERQTKRFKLVQVVYDMIIALYPQLHHPANFEPYTKHMIEAVKNSDLLLPISQSSARDLRQFSKLHGLEAPPMKVIRLGDDIAPPDKQKREGGKPDPRIKKNFILCVGTVEIRKNHTLLFYTYKLATERKIDLPQLLVVGGQGWLTGDVQYLINNDPELKDKILLLHDVDDTSLSWMYEKCLFTVYPSMYEGWGLPIAESLAYGKLCLSSKTSSMPEIAGGLIDYFSPYSPDECLKKIAYYAQEPLSLKQKEREIAKKYTPTSWKQTYEQVLEFTESQK